MTAPQEPGAPTPTLPVASRTGTETVHLSNEEGQTVEVSAGDAVDMLRRGWQPTELGMARALRAEEIPREAAAAASDLGKFGYGVTRGVLTPLVDLALPEGNRVHELLSEDSPWLVGGGEAVGMIGGALLSGGGRALLTPAGALDAGAQAVAKKLGAGSGFVRSTFARGAQGALEGGTYGAMNSIAQAHADNTPLTAQRFASEVVPGLLFGGVLGGGFGAVEGALGKLGGRTITEALGAADEKKLDDVFRAGVSDADALKIAQREWGVKDPTWWHRAQAMANGDVSAERRAMLADSGPVGKRARAEAFLSQDELASAEGQFLKDGNAYLEAREAAMKQLNAGTKKGHIEELVGQGKAGPEDIARAVREAAVESGDWAEGSARRAGFVDRALEAISPDAVSKLRRTLGVSDDASDPLVARLNAVGVEEFRYARYGMRAESMQKARRNLGKDRPIEVALYPDEIPVLADGRHRLKVAREAGLNELPALIRVYDSKGSVVREVRKNLSLQAQVNPGSLNERLINGLARGHQETIGALEQALAASNLSDDAMRAVGGRQGAWATQPMEFFARWRDAAQGLEALPRGVNAAPTDVRKILGNLQNYEGAVLTGRRSEAAASLDNLKKQLAAFAKPGERMAIGDRSAMMARDMYEELRALLEDPKLWGEKFAGFQKRVNALTHQDIGVAGEFDGLFVKKIGRPDPKDPWREARVLDEAKVSKGLEQMSDPKQLEQLGRLREHFDDQMAFMGEQLKLRGLDGATRSQIEAGIDSLKRMRSSLDRAVYLNVSQRQGQAMMGFSPLGSSGWPARMAVGAVLGGKVGAVAGAVASLNPGRILQMRAIAERMADQTESRVAKGVASLLGLRPLEALKGAAETVGGAAGRAAGKTGRYNGKAAAIISHALEEKGAEREQTYTRTVQQLVEARQRLPELQQQIDSIMPDLEPMLPGTRDEMMGQTARGIEFVLAHLPVQPQLRLYGSRSAPLNDHDYADFIRMVSAALEPPSILEMAADGELTPKAVAAAEASAPEFVQFIRAEAARAVTDNPGQVPYEKRVQASLVLGTPLDASLEPDFIALQQATHLSRFKMDGERADRAGGGGGGETGLNRRYMSESDRMEMDEPIR